LLLIYHYNYHQLIVLLFQLV